MSSDKKVYFERKLVNELPKKGKVYKQVKVWGGCAQEFNKEGGIYTSDEDSCLEGGICWASKELFSESFVELIEIEVGDGVRIKKEVLEIFKKTEYTNSLVSVTEVPIVSGNPFIKVNIKLQGNIDLFVHISDISSVEKQIKPKPISVEKSPFIKSSTPKEFGEKYEELLKAGAQLDIPEVIKTDILSQPIGGVKHDQGKLPLFTLIFSQFPLAIQEVCKRTEAGHQKYAETDQDYQNFSRVENVNDRYKNAALRHMMEQGEDQELVGTTHEAAVIWNLLADLECKLRRENGENI